MLLNWIRLWSLPEGFNLSLFSYFYFSISVDQVFFFKTQLVVKDLTGNIRAAKISRTKREKLIASIYGVGCRGTGNLTRQLWLRPARIPAFCIRWTLLKRDYHHRLLLTTDIRIVKLCIETRLILDVRWYVIFWNYLPCENWPYSYQGWPSAVFRILIEILRLKTILERSRRGRGP